MLFYEEVFEFNFKPFHHSADHFSPKLTKLLHSNHYKAKDRESAIQRLLQILVMVILINSYGSDRFNYGYGDYDDDNIFNYNDVGGFHTDNNNDYRELLLLLS